MGHSCTFEESMKVGPWGGDGGTGWSFEARKGGITEILVSHGEVIDSISFKTDVGNGDIENSRKFGGDGGVTDKISFDWPGEYLTTISGTLKTFGGRLVIESLCFHTNISKYGPYGKNGGNGFSVPIEGGVVVGFHGRSGLYLDSIGLYVKKPISYCSCIKLDSTQKGHSSTFEGSMKVGPWGGDGGTDWSFEARKGGITEILVSHGEVIDSITFKTDVGNGNIENSRKFGGDGGETDKISFDWPGEYLTTISGTLKTFGGRLVIESLCFHTNISKYGPCGKNGGNGFSVPIEGGVIVGFHGRSGLYLDSIGLYVKKSISFCSCIELDSTQKVDHVMVGDVPRFPGPWGGSRGKPFDDGVFDGIEQVNVHCRNGIVHAIQLLYRRRDGKSVWSKRHGGDGGDKIHRITLPDNSVEYVVGIIGFYGPVDANNGSEALRSISFYTNKGKYGPFGDEIGTAFCSTVADGMVVGFHGRSAAYLDALGVHMLYF